jgi:acyl-CoA-binding protein
MSEKSDKDTLKIQNEFEKACENIKKEKNLDNETLLYIYGLYKQATEGDCNIQKPSFFDPKGSAKWNAWNENLGMDKITAMRRYVRRINKILNI